MIASMFDKALEKGTSEGGSDEFTKEAILDLLRWISWSKLDLIFDMKDNPLRVSFISKNGLMKNFLWWNLQRIVYNSHNDEELFRKVL